MILGALESLVTAYAANLEWDLHWALDWSLADDLHTRGDNSWITAALAGGAIQPWMDLFETLNDFSAGVLSSLGSGQPHSLSAMRRPYGSRGPTSGKRFNTTVRFHIGSTRVNAVSLGKQKGYVYHAPDLAPTRHFQGASNSPGDGRLPARAKALREKRNLLTIDHLAKSNVASARVTVDGQEGFIDKVSTSRVHSEELIMIRVEELRARGHRVEVQEVFTERRPCTTAQCRPALRAANDGIGAPMPIVKYYTQNRGFEAAYDLKDAYRVRF